MTIPGLVEAEPLVMDVPAEKVYTMNYNMYCLSFSDCGRVTLFFTVRFDNRKREAKS